MSDRSRSPKAAEPPSVSIDEALRLFLAVASPGGLPEGVEQEALLQMLRAKIAADRPEWVEARTVAPPAPAPAGAPSAAGDSYAKLKARIAAQAAAAAPPSDPDERALEERHQEAQENQVQRKAEERETARREDLRRRLIAEKHGEAVDDVAVERALSIRRELERRFRVGPLLGPPPAPSALALPRPASTLAPLVPPGLAAPANTIATGSRPTLVAQPVVFSRPQAPREDRSESAAKPLPLAQRIEAVREWNEMRRSNLKERNELLSPRSSRKEAPTRQEAMKLLLDARRRKEREASGLAVRLDDSDGQSTPRHRNRGLCVE